MLLPPVPASTAGLPLQVQIESLRLKDRRYRNMRVEFKDGQVIVHGTVAKNRDAWDFADAIRQLDGVKTVSLRVEVVAPD